MSGSFGARSPLRLGVIAGVLVALALLAVPASGSAAFRFGAKLTPNTQPSNSTPAHSCDMENPFAFCTWVLNEAYQRAPNGHIAPRRGIIRWLRVIAGEPGRFRVQMVRIRRRNGEVQAKAVRNGRIVNYQGQPENGDPDIYRIERFRMNMRIYRGWRLAIKTNQTSTLRCSSGGDATLLFKPPLRTRRPNGRRYRRNQGFRRVFDEDGCFMLIEAVVVRLPRDR